MLWAVLLFKESQCMLHIAKLYFCRRKNVQFECRAVAVEPGGIVLTRTTTATYTACFARRSRVTMMLRPMDQENPDVVALKKVSSSASSSPSTADTYFKGNAGPASVRIVLTRQQECSE